MVEELSEQDILLDLGELLWSAASAFGQDPRYFADMAEAANLITYKRQLWEARSEALRRLQDHDAEEVREETLRILRSKGIAPPSKRRR